MLQLWNSPEFWFEAYTVLTFLSTLFVVVGVYLEGQREPFPPPFSHKTTSFQRSHEKWGNRLVVLGVAGELCFGVLSFRTAKILEARLKTALVVAEENIERLKANNLENERLLAPRTLSMRFDSTPKSPMAQLQKFKGFPVLVQCIPDVEPRRVKRDLLALLKWVQWPGQEVDERATHIDPLNIPDGIMIFTLLSNVESWRFGRYGLSPFTLQSPELASPPDVPPGLSTTEAKVWWAAEVLSWYMSHLGIDNTHETAFNPRLNSGYPLGFTLSPDIIFVQIGERPIAETIEMRKFRERFFPQHK